MKFLSLFIKVLKESFAAYNFKALCSCFFTI